MSDRNSSCYGIKPDQLPEVMKNLRKLCRSTNVYPSPDQQIAMGHKLWIAEELADIANKHTKTPFPVIVKIDDTSDLERIIARPNLWLKREFSETGLHVLSVSMKNFKQKFKQQVKETKAMYSHAEVKQEGVQVRWFGMPFIEQLQTLGELRVFFAGGKITHTIWTVPFNDKLNLTCANHITPLDYIE